MPVAHLGAAEQRLHTGHFAGHPDAAVLGHRGGGRVPGRQQAAACGAPAAPASAPAGAPPGMPCSALPAARGSCTSLAAPAHDVLSCLCIAAVGPVKGGNRGDGWALLASAQAWKATSVTTVSVLRTAGPAHCKQPRILDSVAGFRVHVVGRAGRVHRGR